MIKAKSTLNDDVHDITPQELTDWKARGILAEVVESDVVDKDGNTPEEADALREQAKAIVAAEKSAGKSTADTDKKVS
jgi:hypothetical protein